MTTEILKIKVRQFSDGIPDVIELMGHLWNITESMQEKYELRSKTITQLIYSFLKQIEIDNGECPEYIIIHSLGENIFTSQKELNDGRSFEDWR